MHRKLVRIFAGHGAHQYDQVGQDWNKHLHWVGVGLLEHLVILFGETVISEKAGVRTSGREGHRNQGHSHLVPCTYAFFIVDSA
jgi:hypothetical protein